MSLLRTVYLGAVICGWMAFGGWFAAEILRQSSAFASEKNQTIAAFCLVGAAIGAGLGLAGGLSNWQLRGQALRMLRGFLAGSLGGISGGWVGAMLYQTFSPVSADGSVAGARWWLRPVGWMAAGALVGLADGLSTLSRNRIRNGLIGGLAGGLIGGILFDPIKALVARAAGDPSLPFEITSRAAGFVAVGLCIGGAVGLTHLLLRHAWLTVLDGDRPGRQVILTASGLTLGSDPRAGLPFLRDADRSLLPTHLRIVPDRGGSFLLLHASKAADADVTVVKKGIRQIYSSADQNDKGISLENDCVIICGRNSIRFNEKSTKSEVAGPTGATSAPPRPAPVPPPKPPAAQPAVLNQAHQAAQPAKAPPPVQQRQSVPQPPPPKKAQTEAPRASQQPMSQRDAAKSAPAPIPASKPPLAPTIAPKPVPQPSPQPRPTSQAENVCPNGHKVPAGQRYCVLCDTYF